MNYNTFTWTYKFFTIFSKQIKSDGRKKDFETIDSLIAEDFDFYMDPSSEEMLKYSKFFHR